MNKCEASGFLAEVEAAVDPRLARLAASLLEQGWPLWQVREHLDWLENTQPRAPQPHALVHSSDVEQLTEPQHVAGRKLQESIAASHQEPVAVT